MKPDLGEKAEDFQVEHAADPRGNPAFRKNVYHQLLIWASHDEPNVTSHESTARVLPLTPAGNILSCRADSTPSNQAIVEKSVGVDQLGARMPPFRNPVEACSYFRQTSERNEGPQILYAAANCTHHSEACAARPLRLQTDELLSAPYFAINVTMGLSKRRVANGSSPPCVAARQSVITVI
ncbi:MAG: hypothetical protein M1828_001920 [Chrysothrix sp. TS-e1954]|nr:MAG: hypothetical protein M1828_001920 [Chrysothrix sp. TS-e1954]